MAALLPVELPADVPGTAVRNGPRGWALATQARTGWSSWFRDSAWPSLGFCGHLENEPEDGRSFAVTTAL